MGVGSGTGLGFGTELCVMARLTVVENVVTTPLVLAITLSSRWRRLPESRNTKNTRFHVDTLVTFGSRFINDNRIRLRTWLHGSGK